MSLLIQVPTNAADNGVPVDPLVGVIETFNQSVRKPRFTPMTVTAAALLALPVAVVVGPPGMILWLFGTVVLISLLITLIHELGHLAVAWVGGFQIHAFAVGPLAVVRNGRSFRLVRNTSWLFAGCVLAIPQDPYKQRGWLAAYAAAGGFANLVSSALALYVYTTIPNSSWLAFWVMTFVVFSLAAGLISIIPYKVGGVFASDGALFLRQFRSGSPEERLTSPWRIAAVLMQDQRPRDWDEATMRLLLTPENDAALEIGAAYMAYLHHLDAGRDDVAASYLQRAIDQLARVPLLFSAAYFAEAAYFFVQRGSSPALAREMLSRLNGQNVDDVTRLRGEAAVLLAEGNRDAAIQFAQHAMDLVERYPGPVSVDRELVRRILTRASDGGASHNGAQKETLPMGPAVVIAE